MAHWLMTERYSLLFHCSYKCCILQSALGFDKESGFSPYSSSLEFLKMLRHVSFNNNILLEFIYFYIFIY